MNIKMLILFTFLTMAGRSEELRLQPGEFADLKVKAPQVFILEARLEYPQPAGAAYILDITVNKSPVGRLLNKAAEFRYSDGRSFAYAIEDQLWNVFYSPDFRSNNESGGNYQVVTDPGQAYRYEWGLPTAKVKEVVVRLRHAQFHQGQTIRSPLMLRVLSPVLSVKK